MFVILIMIKKKKKIHSLKSVIHIQISLLDTEYLISFFILCKEEIGQKPFYLKKAFEYFQHSWTLILYGNFCSKYTSLFGLQLQHHQKEWQNRTRAKKVMILCHCQSPSPSRMFTTVLCNLYHHAWIFVPTHLLVKVVSQNSFTADNKV